jgi:GT2 family glycosyltransferase
MTHPDLSVVIVNWNTREMTLDCLSSVQAGLAGPDAGAIDAQVIVVDNGSEDGSAEAIRARFPDVELIRNRHNRGFAAANNQGFLLATGRYVLLLNSDTVVHGDALSASVAYLDDHPLVGALGIKALNADGTTQMTCQRYPSLLGQLLLASGLWKLERPGVFGRYQMRDWDRDTEREVEVISGCYLMVRRQVLEQVGPLDEDFFFFGEETDWCRRMRNEGWILMFSPVGTFTHYGSASARRLDHRRDVMLAGSKVRLHRKHGGPVAAVIAWVIAALVNVLRAVYWSLRGLGGDPAARARARHFRSVTRDLGVVWRGGTS